MTPALIASIVTAVVALITAIGTWLKSKASFNESIAKIISDRAETKKERDEKQTLTEYRIAQLEHNQDSLTNSIKELQKSIIDLTISVNKLYVLADRKDKE